MDLTEEKTCPGCGKPCRWWRWTMVDGVARHECEHCQDEAEWKPLPGQMVLNLGEQTESVR